DDCTASSSGTLRLHRPRNDAIACGILAVNSGIRCGVSILDGEKKTRTAAVHGVRFVDYNLSKRGMHVKPAAKSLSQNCGFDIRERNDVLFRQRDNFARDRKYVAVFDSQSGNGKRFNESSS